MRCASKYIYVYNAAIGFSVRADERDDQALLTLEVLSEHGPRCAQTIEHGVGITWRIVSMLSAGRSRPTQVWLPHPAVASRSTYRRHLGAPVEFDAPLAALAIDRADLDLPLGEHNEELQTLAVDYLDVQFPARPTSLAVQVRTVIERLLGTGACGYAEVAAALSMHPRTLQRRLREEGTTFEDIKDEARRDLAAAVPGPSRRAPHSGHRPARLPRAVGADEKLPALVPDDAPGAPGQPALRHGGLAAA